jgi:copper chaperone CopZ
MSTVKLTVLEIEGMTCGSCVRHVGTALRTLPGVTEVSVDLRERSATVRHDPGATPVQSLVEALRDEGYPASEG